MKERLRQHWDQLCARDQKILKVGSLVLLGLILVRFLWWPAYHRINVLNDDLAAERSLIAWMGPRISQLVEAKQSNVAVRKDKSLPGLEKSLQQSGLKSYVKEFSQNAQGQVMISFVAVPFESCMEWVEKIQHQGWSVQQMNALKGEKPGLTQLELVLG